MKLGGFGFSVVLPSPAWVRLPAASPLLANVRVLGTPARWVYGAWMSEMTSLGSQSGGLSAERLLVAPVLRYQLASGSVFLVLSGFLFAGSLARGLSVAAAFGWLTRGAVLFGGGLFVVMLATGQRRPKHVEELPASASAVVGEILTCGWRSFAGGAVVFAVVFVIRGPHLAAAIAGYGPGALVAAGALSVVSRSRRPALFVKIDPHAWRPTTRSVYEAGRGVTSATSAPDNA